MIKRILVALDLDGDTSVATRLALDMAMACDASVTGLALVDTTSIEASARGGGIGSMYLGQRIESRLLSGTQELAYELTESFQKAAKDRGLRSTTTVQAGDAAEVLRDMSTFYDCLVVGKEPHFFYSHPEETPIKLTDIVGCAMGPTLLVTANYSRVRRVVIAFDGSREATRTLHGFVQGMPFGNQIGLDVLHIYQDGREDASKWVLAMAREYVEAHGLQAETIGLKAQNIVQQILSTVRLRGADLLVSGATIVSPLLALVSRSTTSGVLESAEVPIWLNH